MGCSFWPITTLILEMGIPTCEKKVENKFGCINVSTMPVNLALIKRCLQGLQKKKRILWSMI